jgi:uncharacterized protein YaaR (DUF327 family)
MSSLVDHHDGDEEYYDDKISNLKSELLSYGKDLIQLLNGVYSPQSVLLSTHAKNAKYDLKNNPVQMISYLKIELSELLQESHEQKDYLMKHRSDLLYCNDLVTILTKMSKIVELINKCEHFLSSFQFLQVNDVLRQSDDCFRDVSSFKASENSSSSLSQLDTIVKSGKVIKLLRNERNLLKSRYKSLLKRILNEIILCDYGTIRINKRINDYLKCEDKVLDHPLSSSDVMKSIIDCEFGKDLFSEIIEKIWKALVIPLWREKKVLSPTITIKNDFSEFILASVVRGGGGGGSSSGGNENSQFDTAATSGNFLIL